MGRLWCVGVVCVGLVLPASVSASPAYDKTWPVIVKTLGTAEADLKGVQYRGALGQCRELLKSSELTPSERASLQQASAYAIWRLVMFPNFVTSGGERDRLLEEALKGLDDVLKNQRDNAEALALRVSVLGMVMRFKPVTGAIHGAKTVADMNRALKLAPRNPRVLLADSVRLFQTPPDFGGDPVEAETQVRQSIRVFEAEPVDRPWPNWGRADAYIWLGQMMARKGNAAAARAEYQNALKAVPGHPWARVLLAPPAKPQTNKPQK